MIHAINIHLPNKVVYSYPLITPNNLSLQHYNTNIHLIELGRAKATLCKPTSNFCKHYKQFRIREKVFSLKKIISLKHNGVRFCFEAFIETNTSVQSDFEFDARCWNYDIFYFEIMCMHVFFFLFLPLTYMHTPLTEAAVPPV